MTDSEALAEALLPCPFCGGEAVLVKYLGGNFRASCDDKNCAGSEQPTFKLDGAIAAWNRRVSALGTAPAVGEAWRVDWPNAPRDGTWVRLRYPSGDETRLYWSTHYSIHGLGGCWSDGFCTMSDLDFTGWLASPAPATEIRAARDVLAERERQKSVEGWTPEHDDEHANGELGLAAACYAAPVPIRCEWPVSDSARSAGEGSAAFPPTQWLSAWPWDDKWWKPTDRRRDLVKAGALILAEIERLDRALSEASANGK